MNSVYHRAEILRRETCHLPGGAVILVLSAPPGIDRNRLPHRFRSSAPAYSHWPRVLCVPMPLSGSPPLGRAPKAGNGGKGRSRPGRDSPGFTCRIPSGSRRPLVLPQHLLRPRRNRRARKPFGPCPVNIPLLKIVHRQAKGRLSSRIKYARRLFTNDLLDTVRSLLDKHL